MKSKDIEAGKVYLVYTANDWQTSTSLWSLKKIRVIDNEVARWRYDGVTKKYIKYNGSVGKFSAVTRGFRAEVINRETGAVTGEMIVAPAHVRGLWDELWPQMAQRIENAAKNEEARKRKQLSRQLLVGQAVELAKQLEVPGVQRDAFGQKVEIAPEVLISLLETLKASGWTYSQEQR